jgi:hypothetical protein
MTGKARWTGFVCVRRSDGSFARLFGSDLSVQRAVRVQAGADDRLRGFNMSGADLIPSGEKWFSSDAEMLTCSVARAAVTCRYWRDHGFRLGFRGGQHLF